jgi:hypothetical protein
MFPRQKGGCLFAGGETHREKKTERALCASVRKRNWGLLRACFVTLRCGFTGAAWGMGQVRCRGRGSRSIDFFWCRPCLNPFTTATHHSAHAQFDTTHTHSLRSLARGKNIETSREPLFAASKKICAIFLASFGRLSIGKRSFSTRLS